LELGKAVKTVFLCKHLHSEELRQEVNEGLKIIENCNSANHLIFYGRSGEISTNDVEEQELSVLSLHLLQNCLVYINILMYQTVLSDNKWMDIMTPEDHRGITPLIYNHINPYGNFELDMNKRLAI
jgi:TnpA family transposase